MITPNDVPNGHLWNSFGHYETEVSARWIVNLCQQKGSWSPFTQEELDTLYHAKHNEVFLFNGLRDRGFLQEGGDKDNPTYHITEEFVLAIQEADRHNNRSMVQPNAPTLP